MPEARLLPVLLPAAALLAACSGGPRAVQPDDFAQATPPAAPSPVNEELAAAAPAPPPAADPPIPDPAAEPLEPPEPAEPAEPAEPRSSAEPTEPRGPLVLDALVGQINGQPVYADDLLLDLDAQLAALGRRLEPGVFRRRASELIDATLRERLVNALILGEAERGLSEQQQAAVRAIVGQRREDLLRRHGQGSVAVTRKVLLEDTGLTLDETLRQFRDGVITDNHVRENLNARINVTRRDVERFYRENLSTFQPGATRDLNLIWVDDPAAADAVRARLDAGEPFTQVAADPAVGNAWGGGLMTTIRGDEPFGRPEVDAAVTGLLEPGAWAGPIPQPAPGGGERLWFVEASAVDAPAGRSLLEAQAAIEQTLRERQFVRLRERFIDRLLREGSHTPVEQMAGAVLQIAVNRYSDPEA